MPQVLNIRTDGVPDGAVYIGRAMASKGLPGSKFANPFKLRRGASFSERAEVIECYRRWLCSDPTRVEAAKQELNGRDLVCWCSPKACHGDVLLGLANCE